MKPPPQRKRYRIKWLRFHRTRHRLQGQWQRPALAWNRENRYSLARRSAAKGSAKCRKRGECRNMSQETLFPDAEEPQQPEVRALNRNGRKPGSRNLRHFYLEKLAKENALALVRAVVSAAINGDMVAAKIIL